MRKGYRERVKEATAKTIFSAAKEATRPIYKKMIFWRNMFVAAIMAAGCILGILIYRVFG